MSVPSLTEHYTDVMMGAIASQIYSLTIVYSSVYSDADRRKHQSSASLAFVWGIHRGPVNSPPKWPVTRKMFRFDDVIMPKPVAPHMPGFPVDNTGQEQLTRTLFFLYFFVPPDTLSYSNKGPKQYGNFLRFSKFIVHLKNCIQNWRMLMKTKSIESSHSIFFKLVQEKVVQEYTKSNSAYLEKTIIFSRITLHTHWIFPRTHEIMPVIQITNLCLQNKIYLTRGRQWMSHCSNLGCFFRFCKSISMAMLALSHRYE